MPRKVLGIRVGETWAYRPGARRALRPALVVNPGTHYDALIRIRLLDDPSHEDLWVRRVKLPCKWEERGEWLESHPEYRPVEPAEPVSEPEPDSVTLTIDALRRVVREEVAAAVAPPVVAYKMADAARATGVSVETLRRAMRLNELVPNYVGTKPIFRAEELQRWVRSLPDEKQR